MNSRNDSELHRRSVGSHCDLFLVVDAPPLTAFSVSSLSEAATPNMSVGANTHIGCGHTSEENILDTVLERQSQSDGEVAKEGGK